MPDEKQHEVYYGALGLFVENYAATEQIIQLCFKHFARIESPRANIIKNEMSTGNVAKVIKALLLAEDSPAYAEVACLLDQFSVISDFRHSVVHRGVHPGYWAKGRFVATNAATARSSDAYEETEYSPKDLLAAGVDLWFIGMRLLNAANPQEFPLRRHQLDDDALAPWRYKRVETRNPLRTQSAKATKVPRRQRRPSQG